MTKNADGTWSINEVAIEGEFKVRYNQSWADADCYGVSEGQEYSLGTAFDLSQPGSNINLGAGTFNVTFDPEAKTLLVENAKKIWSVIGVNDDWSTDVAMTEMMPGIWVSEMITVEKGGWKIRYDKGWDVNRGGAALAKQGEFTKAIQGGDNISLAGTFKVVYNANNETIGTLQWGLVGSISGISGFNWNADVPMNLGTDGKWYSIPVSLTTADEFKIRENAAWTVDRGGNCETADVDFECTQGGANIKVPADGTYMVIYDPATETINLSTLFWGLVGEFNGWGSKPDVFMMNAGDGQWVAYNQAIAGPWKLRQASAWSVNRGGSYTSGAAFAVKHDGDNITVDDKETYSIIYDSTAETITIE